MVRLWMHEMARVFGDRLADPPQRVTFEHMLIEAVGRSVSVFGCVVVIAQPAVNNHAHMLHLFRSHMKTSAVCLAIIVMKEVEAGILFL